MWDLSGSTCSLKPPARHHLDFELVSGADFWHKLMPGDGPIDLGGPGVDENRAEKSFSQTAFKKPEETVGQQGSY